ncbi:MAG: sensor histidine kinase [Desulfobacteraceae bacterium]|nr:MAG: sensor histidine kinase [Desulfobacteraceae bacterium]
MMDTCFAPPERADHQTLAGQIDAVNHSPILNSLLEIVDGLMAILNEHRQIIALNQNLLSMLGIEDASEALGLRPGEAIGCIHADTQPGGCGTTEFCSTCGAAVAMVTSLSTTAPVERMCAITVKNLSKPKDIYLRVRSQPLTIDGRNFLLLFIQDITHQQQRAVVDRIFFHDLNNIVHGLLNSSELLAMQQPDNKLVNIVQNLSIQLSNEIAIQSFLNQSNTVEFKPVLNRTTPSQVVQEIQKTIARHPAAESRHLVFPKPLPDITFTTSLNLVNRVVINMAVNALEASDPGDSVELTIDATDDHIIFSVWNRQFIPEDIARRIFQRNFSTKENLGRGWGSYSMKLLGEQLLGGKVEFTSTIDHGTTFFFHLPR